MDFDKMSAFGFPTLINKEGTYIFQLEKIGANILFFPSTANWKILFYNMANICMLWGYFGYDPTRSIFSGCTTSLEKIEALELFFRHFNIKIKDSDAPIDIERKRELGALILMFDTGAAFDVEVMDMTDPKTDPLRLIGLEKQKGCLGILLIISISFAIVVISLYCAV
jgi:hypothetical protein